MKILFAVLIFLTGCESNTIVLKRKLVFNQIQQETCLADSTQNYALYLPTNYDSIHKWPVIFLFDPHGNGQYAVEKFKEPAELFGYILVGSGNSRNGVGNIDEIINVLTSDVFNRLSVNQQRVYAAGFSGGARVALRCAMLVPQVKGIMMAGAGAKYEELTAPRQQYDLYATVGLGDFNYTEVTGIAQAIGGLDRRFIVNEFEGIHNWPPDSVINDALVWFTLNAMRDKVIGKDKALIKELSNNKIKEIDSLAGVSKFLEAESALKEAIVFFKGLVSTKKFENKLNEIQSNPDFKKQNEAQIKDRELENTLKESIIQSFTTQDTAWWRFQINELNNRIREESEVYKKYMLMRVKSFMGIVAYSYTNNLVVNNQVIDAQRSVMIYQLVEPENADAWFFKAILFDKAGNIQEAKKCIQKSKELGFSDWKKFNDLASKKLGDVINQ